MIEQFHFLRPGWLLALMPWALLVWLLLKVRYDAASWRNIIDPRLLPFVLTVNNSGTRSWPEWMLALVAALSILAMAGPTWEKLPQPVYQSQASLVIALDLSRSMDAGDVKPSRLARARHKISDILQRRNEGQTALIVYAAEAFTVTPLTNDVDTIQALLTSLETDLMPRQGTRADRALLLAFELFENANVSTGDVLLVSDGVNDDELLRINSMKQQFSQHRLSVLAVGTTEGGPVPLREGGFLKDSNDAIVIATLREQNLQRAALWGNGVYASLSNGDIDVNTLMFLLDSRIDQGSLLRDDISAEFWRELGPWLLLLALPVAAYGFRRGYIWLIPLVVIISPPPAQADNWLGLWLNQNQQAEGLFSDGDYADAARLFSDSAWSGAAHFRAGEYEAALKQWQALESPIATYNLGNALAKLQRYEEALVAYNKVLELEPSHSDALHNKQQIEDWLKNLSPNESEPSDSQDGDSSNSDSQKSDGQKSDGQNSDGQQSESEQSQANQDKQTGQSQDQSSQSAEQGQSESSESAAQKQAKAEAEAQDGESEAEQDMPTKLEEKMSAQATRQWLRKIPDDPGGLLRRKFLYQYRDRSGPEAEPESW